MADDRPDDYYSHHETHGYGRERVFEVELTSGFVQYERHVFICHGRSRDWPRDFVDGDPDSLPAKLLCAFKSREKEIKTKTIVTVCEASDPAGLVDGDVFIFPDMRKYSCLRSSDVDRFVSDVLVGDGLRTQCGMENLTEGSFVFVCAHAKSDLRNGVCGELVMKKCNELVTVNKLEEALFPIRCSDIGVPEFAANIIIFSRTMENTIDGHWYSDVSPCDLTRILMDHFIDGVVGIRNWRGKMGNKMPMENFEYPEWWWYRKAGKSVGARKLVNPGGRMMSWSGEMEVLKLPQEPIQCSPAQIVKQIKYMRMYEEEKMKIPDLEVGASKYMRRKEEKEPKKEKEKPKKKQRR